MASYYHSQELYPATAPELRRLIQKCKAEIKERKIKVMFVGAGASGVALSSILAYACKQRRGFVRKKEDINNHMSGVLSIGDHNVVDEVWFVDDLIDGGGTLARVREFFPVDVVCTLQRVFTIDTELKAYRGIRWIHGER